MRRDEFISFCQTVDAGAERYVENLSTHETGRVLSCSGERFEVEVAGKRASWLSENCAATTSTSAYLKYKY